MAIISISPELIYCFWTHVNCLCSLSVYDRMFLLIPCFLLPSSTSTILCCSLFSIFAKCDFRGGVSSNPKKYICKVHSFCIISWWCCISHRCHNSRIENKFNGCLIQEQKHTQVVHFLSKNFAVVLYIFAKIESINLFQCWFTTAGSFCMGSCFTQELMFFFVYARQFHKNSIYACQFRKNWVVCSGNVLKTKKSWSRKRSCSAKPHRRTGVARA